MSGGGDKNSVKPTAEEKALISQQTEALRVAQQYIQQAINQQQSLAPTLFQALGFNVQMDPKTGEITQFEQIPGGAFAQATAQRDPYQLPEQEDITGKAPPRLAALARQVEKLGQQAVTGLANPAVERSISESRQALEAQLRNQFGEDYALSTPSHKLLAEFEAAAAATRGNAYRADLMSFGQLASGLRTDISNLKAGNYNMQTLERNRLIQEGLLGTDIANSQAQLGFQNATGAVGTLSALANAPMAFAQPTASVAGQYSAPLSSLLQQRQMLSQAPTTGQLLGTGLGSAAGAGLGGLLAGPAGAFAGLGVGSAFGSTFGSLF